MTQTVFFILWHLTFPYSIARKREIVNTIKRHRGCLLCIQNIKSSIASAAIRAGIAMVIPILRKSK